MNFGRTPVIGRHIIDIDGCLKATDLASLSQRDILAIIGADTTDMQVLVERYDELVPLGSNERVTLSKDTVQFFRTLTVSERLHTIQSARSARQPLARAA